MKFHKLVTFFLFLYATTVYAESPGLLRVSPRECKHGLFPQPAGPFSAFIFCDDGMGVNLGIIMTSPAADPGEVLLQYGRDLSVWDTTQRFWQDRKWASDITGLFNPPWGLWLRLWIGEIKKVSHELRA